MMCNYGFTKITDMIAGNRTAFAAALILKLLLLASFSSDYQDRLFIPFVELFVTHLNNPWEYVRQQNLPLEFPYPPLMLYLLAIVTAPITVFHIKSILLKHFIFKLPLLVSDITITWLLLRMFPQRSREVLLYYFLSPIILYGIYVHSQLDLIPASLLFIAVYLLRSNKILCSAIVFGLAMSTKFYVTACLPLLLIYLIKTDISRGILYYLVVPFAIYFVIAYPFIFSDGYYYHVLKNPKQMQIYDIAHNIHDLSLYLPILAVFIIYIRFLSYRKVNDDLFYTYIVVLFSMFLLLIYPAPGWYVWMFPFLSIFFIKHATIANLPRVYIVLNLMYLIFFILFFIPEFHDINFLGIGIDIKIKDARLRSIVYTVFEATLLGCVYLFHKFGIRSNAIYNKNSATIIGIGGDSGVGKSTLLHSLQLLLKESVLELEGDGEHKWERHDKNWDNITHLNPKSNLLHNQANYLLSLKRGHTINRRDYDHHTGKFTAPTQVTPRDFVVLCGLHPFYLPIMRKIIDLKIYIDTDEGLRKHWKIIRDTQQRGYSDESILRQMDRRATDAVKFIAPQKEFADIVVSYSPSSPFEIGCITEKPQIDIKISLDSSVDLEQMVKRFLAFNVVLDWEYSDDLSTQYVALHEPVNSALISAIAADVIVNFDDLVKRDCVWHDDGQGFVQLVVLLALSSCMRRDADEI